MERLLCNPQEAESHFPGWEDKGMKVASLGAVPVDPPIPVSQL